MMKCLITPLLVLAISPAVLAHGDDDPLLAEFMLNDFENISNGDAQSQA